ncbi:hypothetical protein AB0K53_30905 [Streptomyces tuirus]
MDALEPSSRLHLLHFPAGQAHLWRDGGELLLTAAGPAGSGAHPAG